MAAAVVAEGGATVRVFEARDRAGGRVHSHTTDTGQVVDLGATFVSPRHTEVLALARAADLRFVPTWSEGDQVVGWAGRTGLRCASDTWGLPHGAEEEATNLLHRLDALTEGVDVGRPWLDPRGLDALSLADWLDGEAAGPEARRVVEALLRSTFCAAPARVSLLYACFYMRAIGGLEAGTSVVEGALDRWIHKGAHQLAQALAARVPVQYGTPIAHIDHEPDCATLTARDGNVVCAASRVVVALPHSVCAGVAFNPPLDERDAFCRAVPNGSVYKAIVQYPRPFWREHGLSGQIWAMPPISDAYDLSGTDGGTIMAFVVAEHADRLRALPYDQRRAEVLSALAAAFGGGPEPSLFVEKEWMSEQWTKGCYGPVVEPGLMSRLGASVAAAHGRLHFAGADLWVEFHGHMEGALRSGRAVGMEVLAQLAE
jgi:monoamine oxidase